MQPAGAGQGYSPIGPKIGRQAAGRGGYADRGGRGENPGARSGYSTLSLLALTIFENQNASYLKKINSHFGALGVEIYGADTFDWGYLGIYRDHFAIKGGDLMDVHVELVVFVGCFGLGGAGWLM